MGFLLQVTAELMQLELGLQGQLFDAPMILQDMVTDSWMKQTWLATCQSNLHLFIDITDFPSTDTAIRNSSERFCNTAFTSPNSGHYIGALCIYMYSDFRTYAPAQETAS